jgi:hexosaminidase
MPGFLRLITALIHFVLLSSAICGQDITPRPVKTIMGSGPGFEVNSSVRILFDKSFMQQAVYFADHVEQQCGIRLQTMPLADTKSTGKDFRLVFDSNKVTKDEMYLLEVNDKLVTLRAKTVRGIINGMQTLLQLLPLGKTTNAIIPALQITDFPRFAYRGMHLDVVRHFFPLSYVKKYIDYLTFHKFNTFHWHLTDDQGWRIEILSYPKLNSIGSWRDSTLIGHFKDTPARYDRTRYGGYYTREEVKEILSYAAVRGITVIPEIDIPGHSRATITAYPELSTDPKSAWGVAYTWGMYNRQNNVLAPNPATFQFLRTVFHEIADLFPSPYIHLGGDECSKLWWKKSDSTQAFMRRNGLKDEIALQTYFIEEVSKYLKEKNKKVLGWHEIMEGKLDTSTIVMNWSNDEKAIEAATKGFSVIMTPGKPYYFDHYQSKDPKDSLAIHGYNSLESVYRYEPVPNSIVKKGLAYKILGGQANVWTEYMEYSTKVDYMVFPRMSAVSESLWTPQEQKDFTDFIRRLKSNIIPRYTLWGSSWFKDFEKWTADK